MKTMKYATPILLALGAILMPTACTNDDSLQQAVTPMEEINLYVAMENQTTGTTRAASGLQIDPETNYNQLGVFVYRKGYTGPVSQDTYTCRENIQPTGAVDNTTSKKLTFQTPMSFPLSGDDKDVDVYVYAPYKNTYSDVTDMEITVAANQAAAADYLASDFVYGKATADYDAEDKSAAVTMYHALVKLTFKIDDVGNGTDASAISEIKLTNVFKRAVINMSTALNAAAPWLTGGIQVTTPTDDPTNDKGDVIVSNNTADPSLYNHVKPVELGDPEGTGVGVSAIIPAQNVLTTAGSPKVAVTIDNVTRDVYLGSDEDGGLSDLAPGYEYVFTLNIKSQNIIVVAVSINPWTAGTEQVRDLIFN